MLMVQIVAVNLIDICRHVISKTIHVKAWNFEYEMDFQFKVHLHLHFTFTHFI
jgi:hypothetical protein